MPKVSTEKPTGGKYNVGRWKAPEEQLLIKLRDVDDMSFKDIADKLSRKQDTVRRRYKKLQEENSLPEDFSWTTELDEQVIAARTKGKITNTIATEMKLPFVTVQERIHLLRKNGRIHDMPSHKFEKRIKWTEDQDEVLLRMWIAMADEPEIYKTANIQGKSLGAIKERKVFLLKGGGTGDNDPRSMYRKLVQEHKDKTLRWTKQDVIDRNFVYGSWKDRAVDTVELTRKLRSSAA